MTEKFLKLLVSISILTACNSQLARYSMDEATRSHPATSKFIAFSQKAKTAGNFNELISEFYTVPTQKRIPTLLGWQKFVYSSPYTVLKKGDCKSIETRPSGSRVQIDCIGTTIVRSLILGDQPASLHLRVFLVQQNGEWFFDKAGYVTVNASSLPISYRRSGIRFKSALEQ